MMMGLRSTMSATSTRSTRKRALRRRQLRLRLRLDSVGLAHQGDDLDSSSRGADDPRQAATA
jgi:hypothetical protein